MNDSCAGCCVRDRALCGSLTDEALTALNALSIRRNVAAGDTVMWAGDQSLLCANLVSGVLKMVAATADGREQIVGLLYPADFVGQPYSEQVDFTITALTEAQLCLFPRKPFERVLENHIRMEHLFLQRTLKALNEARGRMLTLARLSAREKIAALILDLAERAEPDTCCASAGRSLTFDLPLTRGQMADVLGLTIETVSRQLTKLKSANVIALSGLRTITITDPAALKTQANVQAA